MSNKAKSITWNGKTQSINAWAKELNIHPQTLYRRFNSGLSPEEALCNPIKENYIDLTNKRFGSLLVLERVGSSTNQKSLWSCVCDCGELTVVISGNLQNGNQTSCGCLRTKKFLEGITKHGCAASYKSRTYSIWAGMLNRCRNPKSPSYYNYGARGIQVCERWLKFENFLADMGEVPEGMSIDRTSSLGNYEPDNCQWVSSKEQNRNTRRNHYLIHNGEKRCIAEWSEITGLPEATIRARIRMGWDLDKVLNTPIINNAKLITWRGKTQSVRAWAIELDIHYKTLQDRLKQGWSVERALTEPVHK